MRRRFRRTAREIAPNFILDPGNQKSDGILTIVGRDGHLIRIDSSMLDGSNFCWSPDNSKLFYKRSIRVSIRATKGCKFLI